MLLKVGEFYTCSKTPNTVYVNTFSLYLLDVIRFRGPPGTPGRKFVWVVVIDAPSEVAKGSAKGKVMVNI